MRGEIRGQESTMFLMLAPKFEMTIAFPGVIGLIPICDLCKEGSRIFCQWVECQAVDDNYSDLMRLLALSRLHENYQRLT